MEKILSLFRKRQEDSDQATLDNQYFTWNSAFESEADRYDIWHTEYGFDRERYLETVQDNAVTINIVDELPPNHESNDSDVTVDQPAQTQPTFNENGDVITTEVFTYSQFGTEGTEEDGDHIEISTYTRVLLIVGLVICKPFGQIMFDNYLLSRYFEYHGEVEEAARRLRLARIWGVISYMSFVLYMAFIGAIIYLSTL